MKITTQMGPTMTKVDERNYENITEQVWNDHAEDKITLATARAVVAILANQGQQFDILVKLFGTEKRPKYPAFGGFYDFLKKLSVKATKDADHAYKLHYGPRLPRNNVDTSKNTVKDGNQHNKNCWIGKQGYDSWDYIAYLQTHVEADAMDMYIFLIASQYHEVCKCLKAYYKAEEAGKVPNKRIGSFKHPFPSSLVTTYMTKNVVQ